MDTNQHPSSADGVHFYTSHDGQEPIQGKVTASSPRDMPKSVRVGFEALMQSIHKLANDLRVTNQRRHDENLGVRAELDEKISNEAASLRGAIESFSEQLAKDDHLSNDTQLQLQKLSDAMARVKQLEATVIAGFRDTVALRPLMESNREKLNDVTARIATQQEAITTGFRNADSLRPLMESNSEKLNDVSGQIATQQEAITTGFRNTDSLRSLLEASDDRSISTHDQITNQHDLLTEINASIHALESAIEAMLKPLIHAPVHEREILQVEIDQLKQRMDVIGSRITTGVFICVISAVTLLAGIIAVKIL